MRTAEAHRANIFRKLGIDSSAALVRIALLAELAEA
jgi:DNA-binding CsgD family transcriptional regulator